MGPLALAQSNWPIGEQRIYNRWSVAASEFTIHAEQIWWTFAAGYLINPGGKRSESSVPVVTLQLSDEQPRPGQSIELRARTSDDTYRVRYFADWRFIGESFDRESRFQVSFDPADHRLKLGADVRITAVVQKIDGTLSQPKPEGETTVTIRQ
jgi:hypothetical protein